MRLGLVRRWLDLSHKGQHAGAKSGRGLNQLLGLAVRPLYRAYEGRLSREIRRYPVPQHIGIILDGNRRYAERRGVTDPCEIYSLGAGRLDAPHQLSDDVDLRIVQDLRGIGGDQ